MVQIQNLKTYGMTNRARSALRMCRLGRSLGENKRKRVFIDLSVVFHVSELKAKGGEKKTYGYLY